MHTYGIIAPIFGYEMTDECIKAAIAQGNLDTLHYMKEHNVKIGQRNFFRMHIKRREQEVLTFLAINTPCHILTKALADAVQDGNIHRAQILIKAGAVADDGIIHLVHELLPYNVSGDMIKTIMSAKDAKMKFLYGFNPLDCLKQGRKAYTDAVKFMNSYATECQIPINFYIPSDWESY